MKKLFILLTSLVVIGGIASIIVSQNNTIPTSVKHNGEDESGNKGHKISQKNNLETQKIYKK